MASSRKSPTTATSVYPYRMHVSQKYLDLTKQKLELTRLPRDPLGAHGNAGITKAELEPLVDYWSEAYDWRAQEAYYNDTLPQFRVTLHGIRLHFVHKRSLSPTAIPLLFVHGCPESFISVANIIEPLCNPVETPPRGDDDVQSFHVVAPSIPGFGFSDAVPEEANNMQATAAIMDSLMQTLGYKQYIVHGSGWGYKICRILALTHSNCCIAVHTVNPDVPAPRSSHAYSPDDIHVSALGMQMLGVTPPATPVSDATAPLSERPQTVAYALADSPSGLLAFVLDAIRPLRSSQSNSPQSLDPPSTQHSPVSSRSPSSPPSVSTPQTNLSPQSVLGLEVPDIQSPWPPTVLINWTMIYWLAGPEAALRWLNNSAAVESQLWTTYSPVPLGITHFRDPFSARSGQTPPQWVEAYQRIAMIKHREGRVRFGVWERPEEVVFDIRELACIISQPPVSGTMSDGRVLPRAPVLPTQHGKSMAPAQYGGQWQ